LQQQTPGVSQTGHVNVSGNLRAGAIRQSGNHVCDDSNNCDYQQAGAYFAQGGNSFGGGLATLGTNDSNDLALETEGTERVRVDTAGQVGIGTSAPNTKLDIESGNIELNDGFGIGTPGNGAMLALSDDRVGIGTTTPVEPLHVSGNIFGSGNLILEGGRVTIGTATTAGNLTLHAGSGETGTLKAADLSQDTDYTVPDPGSASDEICLVTLGNCAGSGSGVTTSGGTPDRVAKFTQSQNIEDSSIVDDGGTLGVDAGVDLNVDAGSLAVDSTDDRVGLGTTNPANRLTVSGNTDITGNLGVGISSPSVALDVSGSGAFSSTVTGAEATANNQFVTLGQLNDGSDSSTDAFVQGGNSFGTTATLGTNDTQNLALEAGGTEQVRIDTSGNVGIGTTSPAATLDVSGNARLNGKLTFTSPGDQRIHYDTDQDSSKFHFQRASTAAQTTLTLQHPNVGIGTTNPRSPLHVQANSGAPSTSNGQLRISGATAPNERLLLGYETTNDYAFLQSVKDGSGYTDLALNQHGGNVGIGTTSPDQELHVESNVKAGGIGAGDLLLHDKNNDRNIHLSATNNSYLGVGAAGNVAIGTTNPDQRLHVENNVKIGGSGVGDLVMHDASNNRNIRLSATNNSYLNGGKVGIGTTSADAQLEVLSTDTQLQLAYDDTTASTLHTSSTGRLDITSGPGNIINFSAPDNYTYRLRAKFDGDAGGRGGAALQTNKADANTTVPIIPNGAGNVARLALESEPGGTGFNTNLDSRGRLTLKRVGTNGSNAFKLLTKPPSGSPTERLRVTNTGEVGIGTSSPSAPLHTKTSSTTAEANIAQFSANDGRALQLLQPDNSDNGDPFTWFTPNAFQWRVDSTDALTIDSTSRVGIGTANPDRALDVNTAANVVAQFESSDPSAWITLEDSNTSDNSVLLGAKGNDMRFRSGSSEKMRLTSGGNLGIGTTSPDATLDTSGVICANDPSTTATCSDASTTDGDIIAENSITANAFDVAELYGASQPVEAATVVAADPATGGYVTKATSDSPLLGVVSTQPGMKLGWETNPALRDAPYTTPVTLSGRVPVKVTAENGPIQIGDPLTVSDSEPGYAAKATAGQTTTIGIALDSHQSGKGKVRVFVNLDRSGRLPGTAGDDELQGGDGSTLLTGGDANLASLNVSGETETGNLTVTDQATVTDLRVQEKGVFEGDIHLEGSIAGNQRTRGRVTLRAGETTARHSFAEPFAERPFVVASPATRAVRYRVETDRDGFTIHLPSKPEKPLEFTYMIQQ
jgi:hypothetical protein